MTDKMSKNKKVIHTDLISFQAARDKQIQMQDAIDAIVLEALKIGVEISDFRFIEKTDPATLIRDTYWKANSSKFPAGVTIDKAFANTEYNEKKVETAYNRYEELSKTVKPLTIREDSVELTVNESDYNWFLDEDKKEQYTALENFIKAAEDLNQYNKVSPMGLQRAIMGDSTLVRDGKLIINPYKFKA